MITFRKFGRLGRFGNQLFQYAGVRLYAEKNGFKFSLPHWIGCNIFENIKPQNRVELIISKFLPTRHLEDIASYNKIEKILYMIGFYKKLPPITSLAELYAKKENNISIYSYLQDPLSLQLIKENKDKIKNWYRFKPDIENKINEKVKEFKPWIGVHIRRGDYLIRPSLVVSLDKYKKFLQENFKDERIFLASDDPNIHLEFKGFNIIKPEKPQGIRGDIFDFWMLSHAKAVIGGGSTFSWWAALLGGSDYYSPPLTHLWHNGYDPIIRKMDLFYEKN